MKRGLIVAAGDPVSPALLRRAARGCAVVAAADGGYRYCRRAGVNPDILLGDMDSLEDSARESAPPGVRVVRLPREKDDTDTVFAVRRLIGEGCCDITLCCALGGRLDHIMANLHTLLFMAVRGVAGRILDDACCAEALLPGSRRVGREQYSLFSLFPLSDACEGVTILNARYPLDGCRLENHYPVGVSNEFLAGDAFVRFQSGRLLLIRYRGASGGGPPADEGGPLGEE